MMCEKKERDRKKKKSRNGDRMRYKHREKKISKEHYVKDLIRKKMSLERLLETDRA